MKIKLKPEKTIPENLKKKALIVKCEGTNAETGYPSEWDGDFLIAETRAFGDYCVMIDTLPPTITNVSFNANMSGQTQFTFKIEDNLAGIQTYNAWVDDQWILMEYDKKADSIHHFFDNKISRGAHRFKLVVSDDRGNAAIFENTFVY